MWTLRGVLGLFWVLSSGVTPGGRELNSASDCFQGSSTSLTSIYILSSPFGPSYRLSVSEAMKTKIVHRTAKYVFGFVFLPLGSLCSLTNKDWNFKRPVI